MPGTVAGAWRAPLARTQCSELRPACALASQWFDLMPPVHAQAQRSRLLEALGETRFAWSGPLAAGSDVSWTIQGPALVIEYANDARGADDADPVEHVHAVYRDLDRDYGGQGEPLPERATSPRHPR